MTHSGGLPHTNVGDRGQRYEVRATGYPKEAESVIGWSETLKGADEMAKSIGEAPGCLSTVIFDRQENKLMLRRYHGVLR
jgi:hypothetical protein